jgi:hypothetical protein
MIGACAASTGPGQRNAPLFHTEPGLHLFGFLPNRQMQDGGCLEHPLTVAPDPTDCRRFRPSPTPPKAENPLSTLYSIPLAVEERKSTENQRSVFCFKIMALQKLLLLKDRVQIDLISICER